MTFLSPNGLRKVFVLTEILWMRKLGKRMAKGTDRNIGVN